VKILVVNVKHHNEHDRRGRRVRGLGGIAGHRNRGLTPTFGAESVEGNFESYLAAVGVMDVVSRYEGDYDAVVQAGWFIGAALGAIAYFIVTRGRPLVEGPLEETVARSEQQPVD
jgi:hypothetical protein